jgi:ppGpp synthetase/RelA/SpoT-type nucleotidyltranferase
LNAILKTKTTSVYYSKSAVRRAGETLVIPKIATTHAEEHLEALKVLSYWRACHFPPLKAAVRELEDVVRHRHKNAIVAKRLKRTPSIIAKLQRYAEMDLQNMQDIGGCRVIVRSLKHVNQLRRALVGRGSYRVKDYIKEPKEDGYRGIHLVGKFPGEARDSKFQIEIQLRTEIQHAWATALEIIDLFTRQRLKANDGKPDWQEFFCLAAEALTALDGENVDQERHSETCLQVSQRADHLRILERFGAFSRSLKILEEAGVKAVEGYYLLQIDTGKTTLQYQFFPIEAYDVAVGRYLSAETASLKTPDLVVALVSTDSLSSLKEAYPNYFADSAVFVGHLETILARAKIANPHWLMRFFLGLRHERKT